MKTEQLILITTVLAAAALSKGLFVMPDGNVCGANKKALGVCNLPTASGEQAPIAVKGIALVLSGAAITVTDEAVPVVSDAAGKAVAATALGVTGVITDGAVTIDSGATPVTSTGANGAIATQAQSTVANTVAGSKPPQAINGYALDSATDADQWIRVALV